MRVITKSGLLLLVLLIIARNSSGAARGEAPGGKAPGGEAPVGHPGRGHPQRLYILISKLTHTLIYPPEVGIYPPNTSPGSCPPWRHCCRLLLLSSTTLSLLSPTIINITVTLLLCYYYHHRHCCVLSYYQRCCLPHLYGAITGTSGPVGLSGTISISTRRKNRYNFRESDSFYTTHQGSGIGRWDLGVVFWWKSGQVPK